MKLKFDVILAKDIMEGDIFYCNPNPEMNDFGPSAIVTGTDQIFIMDDLYDDNEESGDHSIVVNGGYVIWFTAEEKVVRLAHYSDLIKVIEMVQLGNPDMQIGPNDANTLIDGMIEEDPTFRVDLLAGFDLNQHITDEDEEDHDGEKDEDEEDNGLPF